MHSSPLVDQKRGTLLRGLVLNDAEQMCAMDIVPALRHRTTSSYFELALNIGNDLLVALLFQIKNSTGLSGTISEQACLGAHRHEYRALGLRL